MPPFFLPEIDQYVERDPNLYEILFRIQQAITSQPIVSGGATPTPTAAVDPITGNPLTDASGNPLFTIPQATSPSSSGLPAAPVSGNEGALYLQTDPTGAASGLYMFGGSWQLLATILKAADLAGHGKPATKFLTQGAALLRGLQFDDHGRPSSSFFTNAVDNMGLPITNPLTHDAHTTNILVAATTWQFGGFSLNLHSGSVDPGSFGPFFVFCDDPQYNGGVEVYQAAAPGAAAVIQKRGRFNFGKITTAVGGGGTGLGHGNGGAGVVIL